MTMPRKGPHVFFLSLPTLQKLIGEQFSVLLQAILDVKFARTFNDWAASKEKPKTFGNTSEHSS